LKGSILSLSILLVNQSISIEDLTKVSAQIDSNYVLVSSHEYFPSEIQRLKLLQNPPMYILRDRDFFEEDDYLNIDQQLCNRFSEENLPFVPPKFLCESILIARAEHIRARLLEKFGPSISFYHCTSLGIPDHWWRSHNSTPITESCGSPNNAKSLGKFNAIKKHFDATRSWSLMRHPEVGNVLLRGRVSRISNRLQSQWEIQSATVIDRLYYGFPRYFFFLKPFATAISVSPVHDYVPSLANPTFILQDGHLPRDYTKSALACYPLSDRLVPSNPFSEKWIRDGKLQPKIIADFSDPNFALPVIKSQNHRNVLLALNHAGDWSPFIHRSDTDRIIVEFIELAAKNPDIQFRIRPHPTMVHPSHEGPGSLERIANEVDNAGLQNLNNSNSGLQEDLDWAGVVISEYSQVLLDAWRLGKLGIIFNPTGRRSFLREYEELGFPSTRSAFELAQMIRQPEDLRNQQHLASSRYNSTMDTWRRNSMS